MDYGIHDVKIRLFVILPSLLSSRMRTSILPWKDANNKKCPNCLKDSNILTDNGIPLPSQRCSFCGSALE